MVERSAAPNSSGLARRSRCFDPFCRRRIASTTNASVNCGCTRDSLLSCRRLLQPTLRCPGVLFSDARVRPSPCFPSLSQTGEEWSAGRRHGGCEPPSGQPCDWPTCAPSFRDPWLLRANALRAVGVPGRAGPCEEPDASRRSIRGTHCRRPHLAPCSGAAIDGALDEPRRIDLALVVRTNQEQHRSQRQEFDYISTSARAVRGPHQLHALSPYFQAEIPMSHASDWRQVI